MKKLIFLLLLIPFALQGQVLPGAVSSQSVGAAVSDTLSSEMITNGVFDSTTGWTYEAIWSISGGHATYDNVSAGYYLNQSNADMISPTENNTTYRMEFDIVGNASFRIESAVRLTIFVDYGGYNTGHHVVRFKITAGYGGGITITANGNGVFTIDNISLKKVL